MGMMGMNVSLLFLPNPGTPRKTLWIRWLLHSPERVMPPVGGLAWIEPNDTAATVFRRAEIEKYEKKRTSDLAAWDQAIGQEQCGRSSRAVQGQGHVQWGVRDNAMDAK